MQSSLSLLQPRQLLLLDSPEHERQSHRQAGGKLTLPLSEAVHCHNSESNASAAGPRSEREFVLHAFFDGELDAAVWPASETLGNAKVASLQMKLKYMRWIFTRSAMGWPAPCQVAKSN
jgi:hypothetical protein